MTIMMSFPADRLDWLVVFVECFLDFRGASYDLIHPPQASGNAAELREFKDRLEIGFNLTKHSRSGKSR